MTHLRIVVLHSAPSPTSLRAWQLRNVLEAVLPEVFDDGHADPASLAPAHDASCERVRFPYWCLCVACLSQRPILFVK